MLVDELIEMEWRKMNERDEKDGGREEILHARWCLVGYFLLAREGLIVEINILLRNFDSAVVEIDYYMSLFFRAIV